ncbi:MAG: hypothetical protein HY673_20335 [Chloroflexi bacterium]|nr:hypothetical protein [Chloroflexota bacterium]
MLLESQQIVLERTPYEFLRMFAKRAHSFIEKAGVKLIGTKIRDWQSVEDPTWKQQVLELTIASEPGNALLIWDRLGEMLEQSIEGEVEHLRGLLREGVSLEVKWVPRSDI